MITKAIFNDKPSNYDSFYLSKKSINNSLSLSQKVFGCPTSSYEVVLSMTNEVTTTAFRCRNYALTTALGRHPRMKLNLRRKLSSSYDGVVPSKMSVSDGLIGNIVLLTRLFSTVINGLSPSAILICDSFLCCCDKIWPWQIAISISLTSST